eukprot:COSAG01_NODE_280_length_19520_cov_9.720406_13_plen_363_part_00
MRQTAGLAQLAVNSKIGRWTELVQQCPHGALVQVLPGLRLEDAAADAGLRRPRRHPCAGLIGVVTTTAPAARPITQHRPTAEQARQHALLLGIHAEQPAAGQSGGTDVVAPAAHWRAVHALPEARRPNARAEMTHPDGPSSPASSAAASPRVASSCDIIEAPWLVNGGHGASLRHHKGPATAGAGGLLLLLPSVRDATPRAPALAGLDKAAAAAAAAAVAPSPVGGIADDGGSPQASTAEPQPPAHTATGRRGGGGDGADTLGLTKRRKAALLAKYFPQPPTAAGRPAPSPRTSKPLAVRFSDDAAGDHAKEAVDQPSGTLAAAPAPQLIVHAVGLIGSVRRLLLSQKTLRRNGVGQPGSGL